MDAELAMPATRRQGDPANADAWPSLSAGDPFSRVVEAAPTALVLAAQDGKIQLVNRRAERMFGYDRGELAGQKFERLLPERFRSRHDLLRQRFQGEWSSREMGDGWELFGMRKDGSEFPLEMGLNPIDLDGEQLVLVGIVDVTARRAIECEKDGQRRELERSNDALLEFAHAASHDLKAPLRAIGHLAEWIAEDITTTASAETLDNLRLLQGRVTRLQSLLDGLLAYAKVGRVAAPVEEVDIPELVDDVMANLAPPPGFVVTCTARTGVVRTYRAPIWMVLGNLISNGLKHHDRPAGHITIDMCLTDGIAEFRVADDGPGIQPRFHDRIFVIFQTLARRDDLDSSGIGLAIVKKHILANGGAIRVESEPPARGATFVFTWKEAAP